MSRVFEHRGYTLLVELANVLKGSVTVCTGDSDLVAVLMACGREGITMRLDNKSYHEDRDMHMSTFGELLFDSPDNRLPKLQCRELADGQSRRATPRASAQLSRLLLQC